MSRPKPLGRECYRVWRRIDTRWSDNDPYGHVNNTVYYEWFDTAVNAWLIEQGLLDIESGDPIGLVASTACTYFRALAYPEPVEIGMAAARIGSSSITYRLGVFGADQDAPAAQGEFVHVCVDRSSHRPVPLPDTWRRALQAIGA